MGISSFLRLPGFMMAGVVAKSFNGKILEHEANKQIIAASFVGELRIILQRAVAPNQR